jgi:hypothetical protein
MDVPDYYAGHFDAKEGWIWMFKDASSLYESLFHLCTHALVHEVAHPRGTTSQQLYQSSMCWFSEGLSTYLESFKRDKQGGFVLGAPSSRYTSLMKKLISDGRHVPLPEFMKGTYAEYAQKRWDSRRKRGFVDTTDAQAWSLVYFLYQHEGGKYREKFYAYFKMEVEGKGGLTAAKWCFGDLDALNREYEDFYRNLK